MMEDKPGDGNNSEAQELRARAEMAVERSDQSISCLTDLQIKELIYELKVHQIELEMQNSSLQDAQTRLQESMDLYTNLYNDAPVGYLTADGFGVIGRANKTLADMLQAEPAMLQGNPLSIWCADEDAYYVHCRNLIKRGGTVSERLRLRRRDETVIAVSVESRLYKSAPDAPHEIRSVITDISEQMRLEAQLRQAQKMETVGRLAGGIAHDFNNMLFVIIGNLEVLLGAMSEDDPKWARLSTIREAAQKSANITGQLLAFASQQPVSPVIVDINETIGRMLAVLKRLVGENIAINWSPGADLWRVKIDSSQLDQVLTNLVVNARDSIIGHGAIAVTSRNQTVLESETGQHSCFIPGEFSTITVSDDGCGMDPQTLKNIFEPFYSTKGVGKGTGLGLSTVFGIVQQNGGYVTVDSAVGKGSLFTVYLPRSKEYPVGTQERESVDSETRVGATVLLVEDEPEILNVVTQMLETLKYKVLSTQSPLEAIRIAGDFKNRIDILMVDVVMPDLNGKEVAERIKTLHPETTCLFVSGYPCNIISEQGLIKDDVHFLQKPFTTNELKQALGDIHSHP